MRTAAVRAGLDRHYGYCRSVLHSVGSPFDELQGEEFGR